MHGEGELCGKGELYEEGEALGERGAGKEHGKSGMYKNRPLLARLDRQHPIRVSFSHFMFWAALPVIAAWAGTSD